MDISTDTHCSLDHPHCFIMDWIDIDPDKSQVIWYCKYCYAIPSEKKIKEMNVVKK